MRRHWRKTTIALAGVALIASAVASSASATSVPPEHRAGQHGTRRHRTSRHRTSRHRTSGHRTGRHRTGGHCTGGHRAGRQRPGRRPALLRRERHVRRRRRNTSNVAKLEAHRRQSRSCSRCAHPTRRSRPRSRSRRCSIAPSEYLENTEGLVNNPIGTGPYMLSAWERGSQIVLEANPDYWGERGRCRRPPCSSGTPRAPSGSSSSSPAQPTASTTSAPTTSSASRANPDLQLVPRDAAERVLRRLQRRHGAVRRPGRAPGGRPRHRPPAARSTTSTRPARMAATQFLPPGIPGYDESFVDFDVRPRSRRGDDRRGLPGRARRRRSATARRPRGYLPQPTPIATDIQAQLADIGINVTLDLQESTTFIDNTNAGIAAVLPARLGRRLPGPVELLRLPLRAGARSSSAPGSRTSTRSSPKPARPPTRTPASSSTQQVNPLLAEHIPMVPIAYGGSAVAYKAAVRAPTPAR